MESLNGSGGMEGRDCCKVPEKVVVTLQGLKKEKSNPGNRSLVVDGVRSGAKKTKSC